MKFTKIAAAFAMAIMAMPMSAQFANGGKTGNMSSNVEAPASYDRISLGYEALFFSGKASGWGFDVDYDDGTTLNGFNFQYIHGFGISKTAPIFIETGAKLSTNIFSDSYDDDDDSANLTLTSLSLAVPVNIAYRFGINENVSIVPYTGLNLKFNILGSCTEKYEYKGHEEKETLNCFDKKDVGKDGTWNRFQMGWQIGAGVNINKIYVGLEYGLDFMELYKKCSTSHFSLNLGLNF